MNGVRAILRGGLRGEARHAPSGPSSPTGDIAYGDPAGGPAVPPMSPPLMYRKRLPPKLPEPPRPLRPGLVKPSKSASAPLPPADLKKKRGGRNLKSGVS